MKALKPTDSTTPTRSGSRRRGVSSAVAKEQPSAAPPSTSDALLVEGDTCWRRAHAARAAVLIDAAELLRSAARFAARGAALRLHPRLGAAQPHAARGSLETDRRRSRRARQVAALAAETPAAPRGANPAVESPRPVRRAPRAVSALDLRRRADAKRVEILLDSHLPVGASHHEKLVIVDDDVAYCGGIDLTVRRWDIAAHHPAEPRRRDPARKPYVPQHDVQIVVRGRGRRRARRARSRALGARRRRAHRTRAPAGERRGERLAAARETRLRGSDGRHHAHGRSARGARRGDSRGRARDGRRDRQRGTLRLHREPIRHVEDGVRGARRAHARETEARDRRGHDSRARRLARGRDDGRRPAAFHGRVRRAVARRPHSVRRAARTVRRTDRRGRVEDHRRRRSVDPRARQGADRRRHVPAHRLVELEQPLDGLRHRVRYRHRGRERRAARGDRVRAQPLDRRALGQRREERRRGARRRRERSRRARVAAAVPVFSTAHGARHPRLQPWRRAARAPAYRSVEPIEREDTPDVGLVVQLGDPERVVSADELVAQATGIRDARPSEVGPRAARLRRSRRIAAIRLLAARVEHGATSPSASASASSRWPAARGACRSCSSSSSSPASSSVPILALIGATVVTLGPVLGFVCSAVGTMLAASATFGVGRLIGRKPLQALARHQARRARETRLEARHHRDRADPQGADRAVHVRQHADRRARHSLPRLHPRHGARHAARHRGVRVRQRTRHRRVARADAAEHRADRGRDRRSGSSSCSAYSGC